MYLTNKKKETLLFLFLSNPKLISQSEARTYPWAVTSRRLPGARRWQQNQRWGPPRCPPGNTRPGPPTRPRSYTPACPRPAPRPPIFQRRGGGPGGVSGGRGVGCGRGRRRFGGGRRRRCEGAGSGGAAASSWSWPESRLGGLSMKFFFLRIFLVLFISSLFVHLAER